MKLFVIHRFKNNKEIKEKLKNISKELPFKLQLTFLDSCNDTKWKTKAINSIRESEAIIIYNPESCKESIHAIWEINKATSMKKELIEIKSNNISDEENLKNKLLSIYNFEDEFNEKFSSTNENQVIELYKMMVESSEKLIERRQKTNAFFVTVIGSLLPIVTLLLEADMLHGKSKLILYGFSFVGLLLCNSWINLIDNYGKLNQAKFDVILRLEKELSAQIYLAEWIALGKGEKPKKYKSFTKTEKNVPFFFVLLIIVLTIVLTIVELHWYE